MGWNMFRENAKGNDLFEVVTFQEEEWGFGRELRREFQKNE